MHKPIRFTHTRRVNSKHITCNADRGDIEDVGTGEEAGFGGTVEEGVGTEGDGDALGELGRCEDGVEDDAGLVDWASDADCLSRNVRLGVSDMMEIRTLENQLVFQSPINHEHSVTLHGKKYAPGVPQGHAPAPPLSKQSGCVKSLANHQSIAVLI